MLKLLAKFYAKRRYLWQEWVKTETLLINARSSERTAEKTKLFIQHLQAKAEATDAQAMGMEDNIKAVDEKMAKGFWQCENGHDEPISTAFAGVELEASRTCSTCHKPMKMVRTDLLTGQEKYENEKERREVEKMADGARQQAAEIRTEIKRQEGEIENHLAIAKSFNDQAKRTRDFAELLREL